jgi:hypothetical protein
MFASSNPAGPPNCGHEAMKPRCWFVRAHSIEAAQTHLAADADALDEADDGQDDDPRSGRCQVGRGRPPWWRSRSTATWL